MRRCVSHKLPLTDHLLPTLRAALNRCAKYIKAGPVVAHLTLTGHGGLTVWKATGTLDAGVVYHTMGLGSATR